MNHDERGSENVSELKGNLRKFKLYLFFFFAFSQVAAVVLFTRLFSILKT